MKTMKEIAAKSVLNEERLKKPLVPFLKWSRSPNSGSWPSFLSKESMILAGNVKIGSILKGHFDHPTIGGLLTFFVATLPSRSHTHVRLQLSFFLLHSTQPMLLRSS